jgi:hypothetical protein
MISLSKIFFLHTHIDETMSLENNKSTASNNNNNNNQNQNQNQNSSLNINESMVQKRNNKTKLQVETREKTPVDPILHNNNDIKSVDKNKMKEEFKLEMQKFVLWRKPFMTLYYFLKELILILLSNLKTLSKYRRTMLTTLLLSLAITFGFYIDGAHLPFLLYIRKQSLWSLYWLGLGISSSIGLGTGLHTFVLYLGPFIAQVTLAAYECNSLDFPQPPYPDEITCPSNKTQLINAVGVSMWSIMAKVRLESFMWGAGTAIGELPPYFMARASALSNKETDAEENEDLIEFEQLLGADGKEKKNLSLLDRSRLYIFRIIKKVGFWGILLCASIPNPLFDLAGITCGHFLVKFSTFFGATLIGKAIIKMHIQLIFVIITFSEQHIERLFEMLSYIPYIGSKLQPLFLEWLSNEKSKLHRKTDPSAVFVQPESTLSFILGKIVVLMILFFVVSIINSLAQKHYKRIYSQQHNLKDNKIAND